MKIFNKKEEQVKKIILLVVLILFVLFLLIKQHWDISNSWSQILLFIFSYGLGLFLMLGDEKYLQKIYLDELEEKILITRSPLFILILPFLSIFVLTSTGSVVGIGLIMALNLVILIEIWQLSTKEDLFNQNFLQNTKKRVNLSEMRIIQIVSSAYFLLILFLLLY
ncbi:MAG: hypothetical protein GX559_02830 [Candidatus Pacebacteria bacterium]|nr:hypothetical protein [Candidatus Paceibacterota bacterium]